MSPVNAELKRLKRKNKPNKNGDNEMVKKPIPAWLKNLPVMAHYHPGHMVSQHEDAVVRVVAANKHGWATIEWLDGQNRNKKYGVKFSDIQPLDTPPT